MTVRAPNETLAIALKDGFVTVTFAYAFDNDSGSDTNPALAIAVVAGELTVLDAETVSLDAAEKASRAVAFSHALPPRVEGSRQWTCRRRDFPASSCTIAPMP